MADEQIVRRQIIWDTRAVRRMDALVQFEIDYAALVNLSGRPQINRPSLNTSGTPQKDEVSIRREPTLSKPTRDQFQD